MGLLFFREMVKGGPMTACPSIQREIIFQVRQKLTAPVGARHEFNGIYCQVRVH